MRKQLLFFGDIITLGVAFTLVIGVESGFRFDAVTLSFHKLPFLVISLFTLLILYGFDLYDLRNIKPTAATLWRTAIAVLLSLVIGIALLYLIPLFRITPKTNLFIFFFSFTLLFIAWRRYFFSLFSSTMRYVIVVWKNNGALVDRFVHDCTTAAPHGYAIARVVTTEAELYALIEQQPINILIVDSAISFSEDLTYLLFQKKIALLTIKQAYEQIFRRVPLQTVDVEVITSNVEYHNPFFHIMFRIAECVVAAVVLLITLPFTMLAALAIKLEDGGKIFYTHKRLGYLGREFVLYKFRSMKESTTDNIEDRRKKNDPRVTKVGHVISMLHVDEIPQMINVLKGDMAIVGPRPDMRSVWQRLQEEIPHYRLRLLTRPGFTGWAQIKFHNPIDLEDFKMRLEYDLWYIKHREPFLDLGILVRTVQIIFTHYWQL